MGVLRIVQGALPARTVCSGTRDAWSWVVRGIRRSRGSRDRACADYAAWVRPRANGGRRRRCRGHRDGPGARRSEGSAGGVPAGRRLRFFRRRLLSNPAKRKRCPNIAQRRDGMCRIETCRTRIPGGEAGLTSVERRAPGHAWRQCTSGTLVAAGARGRRADVACVRTAACRGGDQPAIRNASRPLMSVHTPSASPSHTLEIARRAATRFTMKGSARPMKASPRIT